MSADPVPVSRAASPASSRWTAFAAVGPSFSLASILGTLLFSLCLASSASRPATARQAAGAQAAGARASGTGEGTLRLGPADRYQEVSYEMEIHLKADRHRMIGRETVRYRNLSPDTLRTIYFHLYFNAFAPTSMMAERSRWVPDPDPRIVPRIFELEPEEQGYHRIHTLTQEGRSLDYRIFETVLKAELVEPLAPGDSTRLELGFHSQVPLQTRRSGRDNREGVDYSMSQWYPKVARYDASGWHPDPYVEREFYAPFASFDVRLLVPAEYVVGSTGRLLNPDAVGHGYGGSSQDGAGEGAQADAPASPDSLTWHFQARRVHDFAWAADPDFLHDTVRGPDGTRVHLLYQPRVARRWRPMRSWVPEILSFYAQEIGPYPYDQFTVAQAGDGGMEYPQIVFLTGRRSPGSLLGVTAHELAHQWFYGLMATDESDYAWMDEGFTSYMDTEAVHHVRTKASRDGGGSASEPSHRSAYLNWLYAQETGLAERLNTPADWFLTNTGYDYASYVGGSMIVDMLGGVISDSLRDRWLRAYYREYRFDHPDPEDVERLAEEVSDMRLDWFFEQWTNTTRRTDYALADWSARSAGDNYELEIVLEREEPIVMPVDVRVDLADGSERWIHVPRGISFGHKPVPETWTVTEPWPWTAPTDTLRLHTEHRPVGAEIDPEGRLPDRDRLDNTRSFPVETSFLRPPALDWFHYSVGWRPALHYARDFGPGLGVQARGSYLFDRHRAVAKLRIWPRVLFSGGREPDLSGFRPDLSAIDGINYDLSYRTPLPAIGRPSALRLRARNHLGIVENRISVSRELAEHAPLVSESRRLRLSLVHQHRYSDRAYELEDLPVSWNARHLTGVAGTFDLRSPGIRLRIFGEVGAELGADLRAAPRPSTRLRVDGSTYLDRGDWRLGVEASIGLGGPDLVVQRRYRLGSVSAEERWRSDAFRTLSALVESPRSDWQLAAFGTAGPSAYLGGETRPVGAPTGRNMLAGTAYAGWRPAPSSRWGRPLRTRFYAASGTVWNRSEGPVGRFIDDRLSGMIGEAGLALSYRASELSGIDRWTGQSSLLPRLDLSVRLPVWVSDPDRLSPDAEPFGLSDRWMLGIETSWPL